MEYERINLFDPVSIMPSFQYAALDSDGKVYAKLDWLTTMFFDSTMNDVLRWIHCVGNIVDFCLSCYEQSRGYDQVFKFSYNGIMLETSTLNFYGQDLDVSVFDTVCPKIRLELSGSALDYLRSIGVNMDTYRFHIPQLSPGGSYHFTRADWAFDFINYKPEFVDKLIDHINTHKLPSERIPLASTKGAISCKLVTCGQKTVYLGSPQSDRMLRVYDKRMQHMNLTTQTYCKPNPYNDPDSWFRIEWQTRNRFANALVHGTDENGIAADFKSILKDIFVRYAFADGTIDARATARPVVDFWNELFDWQDLERRIIQNAKYVEYTAPIERDVDDFFKRSAMQYARVRSYLGATEFNKRMLQLFSNLHLSDPFNMRRLSIFNNKMNERPELSSRLPRSSQGRPGIWISCDRYSWSD